MQQRNSIRATTVMGVLAVMGLGGAAAGCLDRPVAKPVTVLSSGVRIPVTNNAIENVDVLFGVDNSNSMSENQANLANQFRVLIDQLVNPEQVRDPMTGMMRPRYPPVKSLHVGVISSDLGTPGSVVPSCANTDQGDDGLLNPIRNGAALSLNPPWRANGRDMRPPACGQDTNAYPTFLRFEASQIDASGDYVRRFEEQFVCNAFLGAGGCGIGLPNVRRLDERWGGRVEVWSTRGEGTRFRVSFPAPAGDGEHDPGA